jgi:hypothetical protein
MGAKTALRTVSSSGWNAQCFFCGRHAARQARDLLCISTSPAAAIIAQTGSHFTCYATGRFDGQDIVEHGAFTALVRLVGISSARERSW